MGKIFYGLFATAISLSVAIPCCAISDKVLMNSIIRSNQQ